MGDLPQCQLESQSLAARRAVWESLPPEELITTQRQALSCFVTSDSWVILTIGWIFTHRLSAPFQRLTGALSQMPQLDGQLLQGSLDRALCRSFRDLLLPCPQLF